MGEVIEMRAFRRQGCQAPKQTAQRAAPSPADGHREGAADLVSALHPLGALRRAAALWLSLWAAPLGLRVEAKREWAASWPSAERSVASR
jgi:hypothetical protein